MPILSRVELQGGVAPNLPPEPVDTSPSFGELVSENIKNFNSVSQVSGYAERQMYSNSIVDRAFNPYEQPEFKGLERYADRFIETPNMEYFLQQVEQVKKEDTYRQLEDKAPLYQVIASDLLTGLSDPISYIPFVGIEKNGYTSLKVLNKIKNRGLRFAGYGAIQGGLGVAASEAVSQATMETRTALESGANIAGGVLLGSVLGGAAGFLAKRVDGDIPDINGVAEGLEKDLDLIADFQENGMRNIGAAQRTKGTTLAQETVAPAFGLEKISGSLNTATGVVRDPLTSMMFSDSLTARQVVQELAEMPLKTMANKEGIASPVSVEGLIKQYTKGFADSVRFSDEQFQLYRAGKTGFAGIAKIGVGDLARKVTGGKSDKLNYLEFREAVGNALRNGDKSDIPEVQAAAQEWRKQVFEPMKERAIEVGLLPEDVSPQEALSYFTRHYNTEKISAQRPEFEGVVQKYFKESQTKTQEYEEGVIAKLSKARSELESLQTKIDEVGKAPKGDKARLENLRNRRGSLRERIARMEDMIEDNRIFSQMNDDELYQIASEVTDGLLGGAVARNHYNIPALKRGSLKARTLHIPDAYIAKWLESDVYNVASRYTRSMSSDIELTAKFGRADMQPQIDKINEDYRGKRIDAEKSGASEKKLKEIEQRRKLDIENLEGVRDRLRGNYATPSTAIGIAASRAGRALKTFNYVTLLGGSVVSSLTDVASAIMTHGLTRIMGGGFDTLIKKSKAARASINATEMSGTALDSITNIRAIAMAEVADPYSRVSKFERGLGILGNHYGVISGLSIWTDAMKKLVGHASIQRSMKAIEAVVNGKISQKETERLAKYGIDAGTAERVYKQFSKYGEKDSGEFVINIEKWSDIQAKKTFLAALSKEIDKTVVTPGQDKPLWMSTELGGVLGQFKSFTMSATQRVLISGLQERDKEFAEGLIASLSIGMLVYYLKTPADKLSDDPKVWVREGIDRSGLLGWAMEANNIAEKFTAGRVGLSAALGGRTSGRFASRNAVGALLGPSLGTAQDLSQVLYGISTADLTEGDISKIRRMIPYQNLFYMNWLFNKIENDIKNKVK